LQPRAPISGAAGELQHSGRQIDTQYFTIRCDCTGKLQRGCTTATPNVQNALARPWRESRQGTPPQRGELSFQGFPDLRPRANPHVVRSECE
jgi:hypothetical protein